MPLPLAGLFLNSISHSAIGTVGHKLTDIISNIPFELIDRQIRSDTTIQIPSPDVAIKLFQGGNMGWMTVNEILAKHGIDAAQSAGPGPSVLGTNAPIWRMVIDKTRPIPPLEMWRKWVRQQRVPIDAFREAAKRHAIAPSFGIGPNREPIQDLILNDMEILPPEVLHSLFMLQYEDQAAIVARLRTLGFSEADADWIIRSYRHMPTVGDALKMHRRNLIDVDGLESIMFFHGLTNQTDRTNMMEFLKEMPSPADVVRAGARQNWDHARALRWGLDDEYPADIQRWHAKIGLDYGSQVDPQDPSKFIGPTWAQIAWRDHWIFPPLHSLYASIRRFRGNPQDPATWSQPGVQPLNQEQKNDILQYMGIVPSFREHMLRLAYNPLSIRHIRMVFVNNKVPELDANGNPVVDANGNKIMVRRSLDYIAGKMLDNGVSPDDAMLVAHAMEVDAKHAETRSLRSFQGREATTWLHAIKTAYETGSISEVQFDQRMASARIPVETYTRIKQAVDLHIHDKVIKAVVARARSDYFAGRTDRMGALNRLLSIGMQQPRAVQTIQIWDATRGEGRIHLSTEKVLRALRKGYIQQQEALQRLDNLGWARADELIMLDEVKGDMAKDAAQLEKAATAAQAKQAAELKRLLAENEKAKQKIVGHMAKLASPSVIIGYVKDGIWTKAQAESRLELLGYDADSVRDMFASAEAKAARVVDTDEERAQRVATNLSRLYPPGKVIGYFKAGLWDEDQTRSMLGKLGYTQDSIDLQIADAILKIKVPKEEEPTNGEPVEPTE